MEGRAVQSSSRLYLSRLDHLRFLAALMVLVWHSVHTFIPPAHVPAHYLFPLSLFEEGHTGVSLFMVLSGFIFMALCREKEVAYGDFMRNRVLRIAPLFLVWVAFQLWTVPNIDAMRALFGVLTFNDPAPHLPGVGWTILVEFQFYFLFPFLLLFYRQQGVRYLLGVLLVALVIRSGVWLSWGTVQKLSYTSLFGRIDQFVLGMLACELYHRRPNFFRSGWLFAGSVVGWLGLVHLFNVWGGYYGHPGSKWWVIIPTVEGLFYAAWTGCWLACPLVLPRWLDDGLAWMGKLSFSFYLTHMAVLIVCCRVFAALKFLPTGFGGSLAFTLLVVLPVTTLVSALTYNVIELPFLSMRRNYLVTPPAPAEEPPARLAA
jgi:peptidoglycan/LPS O-acetylase OafA/YrhL